MIDQSIVHVPQHSSTISPALWPTSWIMYGSSFSQTSLTESLSSAWACSSSDLRSSFSRCASSLSDSNTCDTYSCEKCWMITGWMWIWWLWLYRISYRTWTVKGEVLHIKYCTLTRPLENILSPPETTNKPPRNRNISQLVGASREYLIRVGCLFQLLLSLLNRELPPHMHQRACI